MAQFNTETGLLDPKISSRYEVMYLANGVSGNVVTLSNPLPVTLGSDSITITGDVNVGTTVNVSSTPESPVHVHLTEVGTGGLLNVAYLPIGGNVNATITDVITVVVNEDAGEIFGLNNHATNTNRGWTMDNTMRPVISVRLNPATTTSATRMKIVEYEIGNNNANKSTIMYEWYEGNLTIAGATIPDWSAVYDTAATQYRVYQDQYSSNQGNTFTVPSGTVMRHSGIIIGKNTSGDGIDRALTGGATGKIYTLCMKRLDNATKLDVWFAFTFKELV